MEKENATTTSNSNSSSGSSNALTVFSTPALLETKSKKQLEALAREILAEQGADGVQKVLKQTIAKNRALDAEVVKEKKAADASLRQLEDDRAELKRVNSQKDNIKGKIKTLLQDIVLMKGKMETVVPEEQKRWDKIRADWKEKEAELAKQLEEDRAKSAEMKAENEKLKKEGDEARAKWDASMKERIDTFKESETTSGEKLKNVGEQIELCDLYQKRLEFETTQLKSLTEQQPQLEAQYSLYEERMKELVELKTKSQDTIGFFEESREQRRKIISELEKQKKEMQEEQRSLQGKLNHLRTSTLKEMKKKISNLETKKSQLESKCRQLAKKKEESTSAATSATAAAK